MQKSSTTDQNSRNDLHFSCAFLPKTPKVPLVHQHVTFSNFHTLRKFFHKNIKKAHADDVQRTVNVVAMRWACLPITKSAEFSAQVFLARGVILVFLLLCGLGVHAEPMKQGARCHTWHPQPIGCKCQICMRLGSCSA